MQFSVVIPLYNKGPHIERALRSVYAQTHPASEVVVVDDCSSDGGYENAQRLRSEVTRLLRRDRPGPGGYAARNLGVQAAGSSWIAFLDADDEWAPDHLKTLAGLALRWPDAGCVASAYERDFGGGERMRCSYGRRHSRARERRIALPEYLRETARDRCPLWTSALAVRRETLVAAGLFPEERCTRGGDVDTWLRVVELTDIGWSPVVGAVYHRDAVNMVTRQTDPQLNHCVEATLNAMLRRRPAGGHRAAVPATLLWKVENYYRKPAVMQSIRSGTVSFRDVRPFHFAANPFFVAGVALAAAVPPPVLAGALSLARRCRHALATVRRGYR
jgi:succinoglycan biosynthesis protein ExoO